MARIFDRSKLVVNRRKFIKTGLIWVPTTLAHGQLATVANRRKAFQGSAIPANLYSGLIHAWMLNEGSGTTVPDRIGGKDLTLRGSPSWGTLSGMTSISLNGSTQWLDTAAWSVGANLVTMVGWFNLNGNTNANAMFFCKEPINAMWELFNSASIFSLRGNGTIPTCSASAGPSTSGWHQVTGAVSISEGGGDAGRMYIDGVDVTRATPFDGLVAFTDSSDVLNIGRYSGFGGGFYFQGNVGPCYIYNRILDASEVTQLYSVIYLY